MKDESEEQEASRREKLLEFLNSKEPAWKNEDHPELANGAAAWIRSLRKGNGARFEKIQRHFDAKD